MTRLQQLGREQTMAGFFEARRERFEHINWGLARLIRRTARALQYGQSIDKASALQDEQRNERRKKLTAAISTFVTEETDELLKRCHKLLSEAALSSESGGPAAEGAISASRL